MCTHHKQLIKDAKPIATPPYRLNPAKKSLVKKKLEEMLQMDIIEEIKPVLRDAKDWASPIVHLIPKPDGSTRLCVDFSKVNQYTDADPFPLPRIEDLVERVGRAKFLTKIDMTRGYWQVPLDDVFVPISAFVTPEGLFR